MAGVLSAGQARQEMIIELLCPCGRKWSHTTNAEAIAPLKGTYPACIIRELFGCARKFRLMPTRRRRQQNSETIIQLRHRSLAMRIWARYASSTTAQSLTLSLSLSELC